MISSVYAPTVTLPTTWHTTVTYTRDGGLFARSDSLPIRKVTGFLNVQYRTGHLIKILKLILGLKPVSVAERSKARVYGRSLAEIAGSNPAGGMDGCPLWVLCVFVR